MDPDLWSQWWVWAAAALVLGILEIVVPAYIFLGFALGAGVMALLLAAGFVTLTMAWSLVIFAVLSLIAYLALRAVFGLRFGKPKIWDRDINDN